MQNFVAQTQDFPYLSLALYRIISSSNTESRKNIKFSCVDLDPACRICFFLQVVVVLPLFQMLQYPEMDDSMGPNLRQQLRQLQLVGSSEESRVGSSVPKWGEHDNDELYIRIYHIYIYYCISYHIIYICICIKISFIYIYIIVGCIRFISPLYPHEMVRLSKSTRCFMVKSQQSRVQ